MWRLVYPNLVFLSRTHCGILLAPMIAYKIRNKDIKFNSKRKECCVTQGRVRGFLIDKSKPGINLTVMPAFPGFSKRAEVDGPVIWKTNPVISSSKLKVTCVGCTRSQSVSAHLLTCRRLLWNLCHLCLLLVTNFEKIVKSHSWKAFSIRPAQSRSCRSRTRHID